MLNHEITRQILGGAIEVDRQFGPGLEESPEQECLGRQRNLERNKPLPLVYKQAKPDPGYCLELLVKGRIVVDRKSVDGLGPIQEAVILSILGCPDTSSDCR